MKGLLIGVLALALAGCISDQDQELAAMNAANTRAEARDTAACWDQASKLAGAKCYERVLRRYHVPDARDADLEEVAFASLDDIAAKEDRHEITPEQARLQFALVANQLRSQQQQRNGAAIQTMLAAQQALAASRPVVVNVQPQCRTGVVVPAGMTYYNTGSC